MATELEIKVLTEGLAEAQANIEKLEKALEETKKGQEGLDKQTKKTSGGLKQMGAAGGAAFGQLGKGAKAFGAALASTGIGLVIAAIGALVAGARRFQGVMDKVSQVTAGAGVVFDRLAEVIGGVAKFIVKVFEKPKEVFDSFNESIQETWGWFKSIGDFIKQAFVLTLLGLRKTLLKVRVAWNEFWGDDEEAEELKGRLEDVQNEIDKTRASLVDAAVDIVKPFVDAANATKEWWGEMVTAAEKAAELTKASQKLQDVQIAQTEAQAKRNKEIAKARLIAEDETMAIEKRIAALRVAMELEKQNLEENLANARENARIITEQNKLSESSREDLRKEAEAKAAVYQLEEQSLGLRKRLFNELQTLQNQQRDTVRKEELEALEVTNKLLKEGAKQRLEIQNEIGEAELAGQRHTIAEIETARMTFNERLDDMLNANVEGEMFYLDALSSITGMFKENSKRAFQINKAASIAETIVSTYSAAQKAYNSQLSVPTPDAPIRAAVAAGVSIAQGLARVAAIKNTKFEGGGGGAGGGGGVSAPRTTFSLPETATQNTGQGITPAPIQAVVVSQEITNQQALDSEIRTRSRL